MNGLILGLDNLDTNKLTPKRTFINITKGSRVNRRILQVYILEIESLRIESRLPREANQRNEENKPKSIRKLRTIQELMVYEKASYVKLYRYLLSEGNPRDPVQAFRDKRGNADMR